MVTIKDELEIQALGKLLNFIKFDCSDADCLLFAASPYINSVFKNVLNELNEIYSKKGRPPFENENYIESYPIYLLEIKKNIERTSNWNKLDDELKNGYVHDLISPYQYLKETLFSLTEYGDKYHKV